MVKFPLAFGTQKKLIHQIGTIFTGWWLTYTPLKNMTSSVGRMTFPIVDGKKKCSKAPTSFASFFRQDAGELSAAQLVHGISALTIRRQTRVPLILLGSLVRWFCAKRGSTWDPRKTPRPTTGISSAELGDDHIPSGKLT